MFLPVFCCAKASGTLLVTMSIRREQGIVFFVFLRPCSPDKRVENMTVHIKKPLEALLSIISIGEGHTIEFKKSTLDITKDVYESICAFSNRDGGHVFLGVKDNGEVLGIHSDCIEKMKKDFVTAINNANKMYPPLFLTPIEYEIHGKKVLHIYVPEGTQVSRCSGRIYDRNNESDIDITDNEELVYKLYARKQGTYFVNKVFPNWGMGELRSDLIERARKMTYASITTA